MNEKVKLTQAQADALEYVKSGNYRIVLIKAYMKIESYRFDIGETGVLYELSHDDFFRALYVGYEVEPEYRAQDWVAYADGKIGQFMPVPKGYAQQIPVRHATKSEIAAEKERRFWSKHGRGIHEYRLHDIVRVLSGGIGEITAFESKGVGESLIEINDCASFKTERIKLVCPVESRLDISHE